MRANRLISSHSHRFLRFSSPFFLSPISPLFPGFSLSRRFSTSRPGSSSLPDFYSVLGVPRHSPNEEDFRDLLKKSYYSLAAHYHPDKNHWKSKEIRQWGEKRFQLISSAYSILSDPVKKQHYDTFYDLTSIGDQDRMLHWLKIHRPPEKLTGEIQKEMEEFEKRR